MRDGTRQSDGRRPAKASVDGLDDWEAIDAVQTGDRLWGEERPAAEAEAETEPDTSERIILIEFVWWGLTGSQPVILVSREWLQ